MAALAALLRPVQVDVPDPQGVALAPAQPRVGEQPDGHAVVSMQRGSVGQLAPGGRLVAGDLAAVLFVGQGVVQPWQ